MDNLTPAQRHKNMQNIRSQDSKAERLVAQMLREEHISYSRHLKSLPGTPDFVIRGLKTAVFVDSDFWHGHPKRFVMPKTNINYWRSKIQSNKARDKRVRRQLRRNGWSVISLWEFDILKRQAKTKSKLIRFISKRRQNVQGTS